MISSASSSAVRSHPPCGADRSWHAIAEHLDELGKVIDAGGTIEQTLTAVAAYVDPHLAR